jgi:hypothetical protein
MNKIKNYYNQYKIFQYKKEIDDIRLENININKNIQKLSEYTKLPIDEVYEYIEKYALSKDQYNEKSTLKIINKKIDSLLKYELYRVNMINDIQKIKNDIKENERIDAIFRTSLSFLSRKKIHIDLYSNPIISKLEVIRLYKKHYNSDP